MRRSLIRWMVRVVNLAAAICLLAPPGEVLLAASAQPERFVLAPRSPIKGDKEFRRSYVVSCLLRLAGRAMIDGESREEIARRLEINLENIGAKQIVDVAADIVGTVYYHFTIDGERFLIGSYHHPQPTVYSSGINGHLEELALDKIPSLRQIEHMGSILYHYDQTPGMEIYGHDGFRRWPIAEVMKNYLNIEAGVEYSLGKDHKGRPAIYPLFSFHAPTTAREYIKGIRLAREFKSWGSIPRAIVHQIVLQAVQELPRESPDDPPKDPSELTVEDFHVSLPFLGNKRMEAVLRNVYRNRECPRESRALLDLKADMGVLKWNIRDVRYALATNYPIPWAAVPDIIKLLLVENLAKSVGKPVQNLLAGDFDQPVWTLGGISIRGLLNHYAAQAVPATPENGWQKLKRDIDGLSFVFNEHWQKTLSRGKVSWAEIPFAIQKALLDQEIASRQKDVASWGRRDFYEKVESIGKSLYNCLASYRKPGENLAQARERLARVLYGQAVSEGGAGYRLEDPLVEKLCRDLAAETRTKPMDWAIYMLYRRIVATGQIRGRMSRKNVSALYGKEGHYLRYLEKRLEKVMMRKGLSDEVLKDRLMELKSPVVSLEQGRELARAVFEQEDPTQILIKDGMPVWCFVFKVPRTEECALMIRTSRGQKYLASGSSDTGDSYLWFRHDPFAGGYVCEVRKSIPGREPVDTVQWINRQGDWAELEKLPSYWAADFTRSAESKDFFVSKLQWRTAVAMMMKRVPLSVPLVIAGPGGRQEVLKNFRFSAENVEVYFFSPLSPEGRPVLMASGSEQSGDMTGDVHLESPGRYVFKTVKEVPGQEKSFVNYRAIAEGENGRRTFDYAYRQFVEQGRDAEFMKDISGWREKRAGQVNLGEREWKILIEQAQRGNGEAYAFVMDVFKARLIPPPERREEKTDYELLWKKYVAPKVSEWCLSLGRFEEEPAGFSYSAGALNELLSKQMRVFKVNLRRSQEKMTAAQPADPAPPSSIGESL